MRVYFGHGNTYNLLSLVVVAVAVLHRIYLIANGANYLLCAINNPNWDFLSD